MPFVHIDLIAGRSREQLRQMCADVTEAIAKNTGAPKEHIHIVLNEMAQEHYAVGGVLKADEK